MDTRKSNTQLDRLHKEAGWTQGQFARAVNLIGTERGTPTTFGESTVHYWRKGVTPKEKVRPLILEALSRKLGRLVTHSEAGFPASIRTPNSCSTVEELIDLGRQDVERRNLLGASLFSVALTIPNWPDIVGRMESVQAGGAHRIGMSDVELVTKMTDRLWETFEDFGGEHTRPMAALFLANTVAPYLRADAPEAIRKAMMSSASFLCYLTGWTAEDEALHGLAQRYYRKGLEFAGASGDHLTYCHVLRGMSVQAADLGHGPDAVRLADAAAAASPKSGPRMQAFFAAQQGYASAVSGNDREALARIRETEKSLDIAESGTRTFGGFSASTLAYATSQVRYHSGDVKGSIDSLELHFRLRDTSDTPRSAVRFSSILAERQLELGHLEAACSTWNQVLDEYPSIHSGRVDRHVADIGRRLRPYCSNSTAREVYERALRSVRA
ncbi:tetratricopeptide repeat protein [Streptomyces jumonjinensis]|uniref:Tetratricopeptide repeat protein n=1 Tax=Streptomyces jumonjinensis TaxID=1945 RepID=A0A646KKW7_STRJU|nr:tetratricopeptide repeat protein [Streptomyces jumonjinensis]MQT02959.1 tetratricopeptide repeat protein [Streptomyces jumonjinensis]